MSSSLRRWGQEPEGHAGVELRPGRSSEHAGAAAPETQQPAGVHHIPELQREDDAAEQRR